jgi:formamidopyrimidine-DNA glycosylase
LYHAKIHPEQYSNTLGDEQIKELHSSIQYVCTTSIDVLADSEKFPEHWLFKHRWGKGKKNKPSVLPNGEKIVFLTVGGRTSAVVPSVQKKTGPVAKDIGDEDAKSPKSETKSEAKSKTKSETKRKRVTGVKKEEDVDDEEEEEEPKPKKKGSRSRKSEDAVEVKTESKPEGRRRSTRLRK